MIIVQLFGALASVGVMIVVANAALQAVTYLNETARDVEGPLR